MNDEVYTSLPHCFSDMNLTLTVFLSMSTHPQLTSPSAKNCKRAKGSETVNDFPIQYKSNVEMTKRHRLHRQPQAVTLLRVNILHTKR